MTGRRPPTDRGATAVEYALGMALFVVVIIGGLQLVQSSAEEQLVDDREAIAEIEHLGTVASTTSTPSTVPGPTTTAPTTTTETTTSTPSSTTTTAPPSLEVTCTGATCTFHVWNAPPGATYTWTGPSPIGDSTAAVASHTRPKNAGDYDVTVALQPSGWTATASVACSQGSNTTCTPA